MENEYLNFQEISKVPFKDLLDWLNIPYKINNGELKGEWFVVNVGKNLFFSKNGKGSVINFLSTHKQVDLRTAAKEIKDHFQGEKQDTKEIPNLILQHHKLLDPYGITEDISIEYEVGFVKQRSIFAGKLAFKVYEGDNHVGYVAYDITTAKWLFPKGFKRVLYNAHRVKEPYVFVTVSPFDVFNVISKGENNVVALLAKSMTDTQEEQLKPFRHIILLHPEPENLILRLSQNHFVKAVKTDCVPDDIRSLL